MPAVFALGAIVIFVALGSWQLQRKAWKEALIESLEQRLSAPPVDLQAVKAAGVTFAISLLERVIELLGRKEEVVGARACVLQ